MSSCYKIFEYEYGVYNLFFILCLDSHGVVLTTFGLRTYITSVTGTSVTHLVNNLTLMTAHCRESPLLVSKATQMAIPITSNFKGNKLCVKIIIKCNYEGEFILPLVMVIETTHLMQIFVVFRGCDVFI